MLATNTDESSSSHLETSPRTAIKLASPPLPLPSIAIDPQLDSTPRAPHLEHNSNSRDRGRRVQSPSRTRHRENDGGYSNVARTGEQHRFDPSLDRDKKSGNSSFGPSPRESTSTNSHKPEQLPGPAHLLNNTQMPHRVIEPYSMPSSYLPTPDLKGPYGSDTIDPRHARDYNQRYGGYGHSQHIPSPPPIATLPHSPSLSVSSLDHSHSSTSSPHPPRRPLPRSSLDAAAYLDPYYPQDQSHQHQRHASGSYPHPSPRSTHAYPYPPRQTYESRYNPNDTTNPPYQMTSYPPHPTHPTVPSMGATPSMRDERMYTMPGQQQQYPPITHTDDATTKLSDRVRRRCFNCCTTDTSTWRRSSLSPGKVLCNKCGLFERTHSRPRPDQFPHRRGSVTAPPSGPVRLRTPPGQQQLSHPYPHPPHIATQHVQTLPPPHHYEHPSIAPLANPPDPRRLNNANTLPEIQSWINSPHMASSQIPSGSGRSHEQGPSRSPPLARLQHPHGDSRPAPSSHGE